MYTSQYLAVDAKATYRIYVQGTLVASWSERMDVVAVQLPSQPHAAPVTMLTGNFKDQAALAGVLDTLFNLRLPLLAVECIEVQLSNRDSAEH